MEPTAFPGARLGGEQQTELTDEDRAMIESCRTTSYYPSEPCKFVVHDHSLASTFRQSASFQKIVSYLQGCSEAVWKTPSSARVTKELGQCCDTARYIVEEIFVHLNQLVTDIPLEDQTKQRFGNRAKRVFHQKMESDILTYMTALVRTLPPKPITHAKTSEGLSPRSPSHEVEPYFFSYATSKSTAEDKPAEATRPRTDAEVESLSKELAAYLEDSFGNPTRLDFGSGHELHFFIFLMILLEELGDMGGTLQDAPTIFIPLDVAPPQPVPAKKRGSVTRLRQDFMFYVFIDTYLPFVRRLQKHYSLEPAGSHGVWGLDDYHHIPYVLGAAQLVDAECTTVATREEPILTKYVCEKARAHKLKDEYLYFTMIDWIYENKIGPFFEHSNTLYNISGVERWSKIYQGMMKMFGAEVLNKFNVSQHMLFGKHLPWNTKTL